MDDPHPDAGAPTFTAGRDGACDDVQLLRRIGQGDEDAMAAFYREHGRVVLAQVLPVAGEAGLTRSMKLHSPHPRPVAYACLRQDLGLYSGRCHRA